jgi:hypothetical protein
MAMANRPKRILALTCFAFVTVKRDSGKRQKDTRAKMAVSTWDTTNLEAAAVMFAGATLSSDQSLWEG